MSMVKSYDILVLGLHPDVVTELSIHTGDANVMQELLGVDVGKDDVAEMSKAAFPRLCIGNGQVD